MSAICRVEDLQSRPESTMNLKKRVNRLPSFTHPGCVVTHHRSKYCRGLCVPINGYGPCGRLAPHAMMSRYQLAIAAHKMELERAENEQKAEAV